MEAKRNLRRVLISITFCAFALLTSTCGGGRQPTPQSGVPDVLVGGKDTPETDLIRGRLDTDLIQGGNGKSVSLVDVLRELEDMPPPAGVDADTFAQLKSALSRQLNTYSESRRDPAEGRVNFSPEVGAGLKLSVLQDEGKFVSKPPTGKANRINDLWAYQSEEGNVTLTWSYVNIGDYNQDGIVSIQDITPLAEHFQETAEGEGDSWRGWIDGNRDGLINIADVTPLAEHFYEEVAKYIIQIEDDEGNWTTLSDVSFSSAVLSETGRKNFSVEVSGENLEGYLRARIVSADSDGGQGLESNLVNIAPPVVTVTAVPSFGDAPLTVTFDATGTSDPDGGSIGTYDWDWGNDGVYDANTGEIGLAEHTFDGPGEYLVGLRVSDDEAFYSQSGVTLKAYDPEWTHTWTGGVLWTNQFGEVIGQSAQVYGIAVDTVGNIYGVGEITTPWNNYDTQALIIKVDGNGNLVWAKMFGMPTGPNGERMEERLYHVALDNRGNVIVTGDKQESVDFRYPNGILLKLDSFGNAIWAREWGVFGDYDGLGSYESLSDVVVDDEGEVYAVGTSMASEGVALLKFSADGVMQWQTSFGSPFLNESGSDIAFLENGNLLLIMGMGTRFGFAGVLAEINPDDGWEIRAREISPNVNYASVSGTVGVDGNIYMFGRLGLAVPLVVCVDSSLEEVLWTRGFMTGGMLPNPYANGIVGTARGEAFVIGETPISEGFPFTQVFLAKVTPDSVSSWVHSKSSGASVVLGAAGKLFIGGTVREGFQELEDLPLVLYDQPLTLVDSWVPDLFVPGEDRPVDIQLVDLNDEGILDVGNGWNSGLIMKRDPGRL